MSGEAKVRASGEDARPVDAAVLPVVNPASEKSAPAPTFHPALYVVVWISLSSSVILFNKWILHTLKFPFPIFLTTWHLLFASLATQLLARTTTLLDGRKKVKMSGRLYLRAIVPIGFFFSLSLICGNVAYLTLSVAFIQMIKATTPVAVLIAGWAMGADKADLRVLFNVSAIVIGVVIASFGEIRFVLSGFLFQCGGIVFESIRLVMVQRLLNSPDLKMDPLVSLYYFAPVCALMNGVICLFVEIPKLGLSDIGNVGLITLFLNALVAFGLNVSVVFLIGKTSSLVLTLCGVLKDILLVAASILIWGTPISALQYFGYTIALCGLVYYKLGATKIVELYRDVSVLLSEYGNRRPFLKKLLMFAMVATVGVFVVSLLATAFFPDQVNLSAALKDKYASIGW